MGNLTAAILTLVLISPSIIVLAVIIYRQIREFWRWIAPFCSRGLSQVDCTTSLLRVQARLFRSGCARTVSSTQEIAGADPSNGTFQLEPSSWVI